MVINDNNPIPALAGIYRITNLINGKIYIGKSLNLSKRLPLYKWELSSVKKRFLIRAMIKHGFENFKCEIMELYPTKDRSFNKYLLNRESFWIKFYQATTPKYGYNICEYGIDRTGCKASAETKEKQRIAHLGEKSHTFGKHLSQETKQKLSDGRSGSKHWFFGKKFKEEHRRNISLGNMGKTMLSKRKKIRQLDKITNEIINEWNSVFEAAKFLNVPAKHISRALTGKRKSSNGFKWEYVEPSKCNSDS